MQANCVFSSLALELSAVWVEVLPLNKAAPILIWQYLDSQGCGESFGVNMFVYLSQTKLKSHLFTGSPLSQPTKVEAVFLFSKIL